MNTISQWLNGGKDYHTGVALYRALGNDPSLIKMFDQGESPFRKERLVKELQLLSKLAINAIPVKSEPVNVVSISTRPAVLPEQTVQQKEDPYADCWKPAYKEMNYLRSQLEHVKTDEQRGEMAFRILDLERECMRWWAKSRHFQKFGEHIQDEKTEEDMKIVDRNALHKKLMNLRSVISKTRKKLGDAPDNETLSDKLLQCEKERDRLEQQLEM